MGGLEGGGFQRSLLPLFPTFIATHDPSPPSSLAAFLWLFSAPGTSPFPVMPTLGLVCLDCLSLQRLLPRAVAPLLLPMLFPRLAPRASFSLRRLFDSLCTPGGAPLLSCPNYRLLRGSPVVSPVGISSDDLGQLFLWHHHQHCVNA